MPYLPSLAAALASGLHTGLLNWEQGLNLLGTFWGPQTKPEFGLREFDVTVEAVC